MQNFKYFTEAKMARQHFQLIADVIASLELQRTQKDLVARKFQLHLLKQIRRLKQMHL